MDSDQNATGEAEGRVPDLIPARMLNEFAYCPRLAYLEWVQGEFADNAFTEDGRYVHRRVDREQGDLAAPEEPDDTAAPKVARSVMLSAPAAGLVARIDLVEAEGRVVVPIDYKRGRKPEVPEGAYEPERVQLCAQGIILRENGYTCSQGVLYFAGSRERVPVVFDDALVGRTLALAAELREVARRGPIPPPLDDSPKCDGCSLMGICLPDETAFLRRIATEGGSGEPRRLVAARDDALPCYVQAQGAFVGKDGDRLVIKHKGEIAAEARLLETSQVCLFGSVQISTAAVRELCSRGIPLAYFSYGGWFYGMTLGTFHKNAELRLHQYRHAASPVRALRIARRLVAAKIRNSRLMLRRNAPGLDGDVLASLRALARTARVAPSLESLLGIEGTAARRYFEAFPAMLKQRGVLAGFTLDGRNRRPPKDPVNALLSFAYALLAKDLTVTLAAVGFDPFVGFYHQPRYGRPSLALDLMEEFRPLVADSVVISVLNNGIVGADDFTRAGGGVALGASGRKAFLQAYERRMDQLIRHPLFGYQVSYRRVLELQARLLARFLAGEIRRYPELAPR